MELIDYTYFIGGINIPGLGGNSNSGNDELFEIFAKKKEREVLIKALGVKTYNGLQTAITDASNVLDDLAEPWRSLVLGKEYDIDVCGQQITVSWGGLVNDRKESLIAYYLFWYWMQDASNQQAYIATVQASMENAEVISPFNDMTLAWRNFIALYGKCSYCKGNMVCLHEKTENSGNIERSLREFILDQNELVTDTFADWTWQPLKNQNRFGI